MLDKGRTEKHPLDIFSSASRYRVEQGYSFFHPEAAPVPWRHIVWARTNTPRHATTLWMIAHHKLPTRARIHTSHPLIPRHCEFCQHEEESITHLLTTCPYAIQVWNDIQSWWPLPAPHPNSPHLLSSLDGLSTPRSHRLITYAIFAAVCYNIWYARNCLIFKSRRIPTARLVSDIKAQVRYRILTLHRRSNKFHRYITPLLM